MKKALTLGLFLLITQLATAHYIWIETQPVGTIDQDHEIHIRFGEYTYGAIERVEGEAFQSVKDFELWLIAPDGTKQKLTTTPKEDFYKATFRPTQQGTYTIALDNKTMKVLDYTEYDFGIFKPQYHAKARVVVGNKTEKLETTNSEGIEIIDESPKSASKGNEVKLKVLFKGKPLVEQEVSIFISDQWSKKLTTDDKGLVSFNLPWKTLYTVETTHNEETPGTFQSEDYEFIWHCATYAIKL